MSQTIMMILVVGAIIGAVIFRCKTEILAPLCEAWPEGASIVGSTPAAATSTDTPDTPTIAPITLPPKKVAVRNTRPIQKLNTTASARTGVGAKPPMLNATGSAKTGAGSRPRLNFSASAGGGVGVGARYTSLFTTERVFI